jgi:hypothetical protein
MGKKIASKKKTTETSIKVSLQKKDSLKKNKSKNEIKIQLNKNSLSLESKKVAVSYKNLNKSFKQEDIDKLTLKDLKILASNFDINPLVNFKLLSLLREKNKVEYNKFIVKYKYTLNYSDAKKLNCFDVNEESIKNECNKNFGSNIKEIISLSKAKLFNFLFFIINLKYDKKTFFEEFNDIERSILDTLESYKNECNLIFKVPNNFGNPELQYYTYLSLFVNYYYKKIEYKNNKDDNILESDDLDLELKDDEIYFDWDKDSKGKTEKLDMSKFEEKKEKLKKYLDEDDEEINDLKTKEGEKTKNKVKSSTKMEIDKEQEEFKKRDNIKDFILMHAERLKKYEDELKQLFKEQDDGKVIKNLEFIYTYLLFTKNATNPLYDNYPNCLYVDPSKNNEYFNKYFIEFTSKKARESIIKDELVFLNLDFKFMISKDNPFCNNAQYYKYPILLKKNIFQSTEEMYNFFKNCLKDIYKSELLEEI